MSYIIELHTLIPQRISLFIELRLIIKLLQSRGFLQGFSLESYVLES